MEIRHLIPVEEPHVRALLLEAALPVEDLPEAEVHFLVATDRGQTVGAVGLEVFATVGLLRSLVVRADARGGGIGGGLVDALEAHARGRGLTQLVLLTQTAEAFFADRGFRVIDRQAAPDAVKAGTEFRSVCPASATCMTKPLT